MIAAIAVLSVLSILSYNAIASWQVFGRDLNGVLDYLANNIMLPLGGLLMALFVGFVLPRALVQGQLGYEGGQYGLYLVLIRFVAPAGVAAIFGYTIYQSLAS